MSTTFQAPLLPDTNTDVDVTCPQSPPQSPQSQNQKPKLNLGVGTTHINSADMCCPTACNGQRGAGPDPGLLDSEQGRGALWTHTPVLGKSPVPRSPFEVRLPPLHWPAEPTSCVRGSGHQLTPQTPSLPSCSSIIKGAIVHCQRLYQEV